MFVPITARRNIKITKKEETVTEKVLAYLYSQEMDRERTHKDEVEIIDSKTENGVTSYIVKTKDEITCSAIYNIFTNAFYADDVYGVVDDTTSKKAEMEM